VLGSRRPGYVKKERPEFVIATIRDAVAGSSMTGTTAP
jgi:hypothetical protein